MPRLVQCQFDDQYQGWREVKNQIKDIKWSVQFTLQEQTGFFYQVRLGDKGSQTQKKGGCKQKGIT